MRILGDHSMISGVFINLNQYNRRDLGLKVIDLTQLEIKKKKKSSI